MKKELDVYPYDFEKYGYQPVPPPSLNGGLYTGEPFYKDAPYANIHIDPDVTVYMHDNLLRGNNPPAGARYQYPSTRRGNSYVEWRGLAQYKGTAVNWGPHNIYTPPEKHAMKQCNCEDICPNQQTQFCNKDTCRLKKKVAQSPGSYSKYYYVP